MENRFELLMYACKRENILKFVSTGKLSEPYNKIFNNDCLFCITAVGSNAVRPSAALDSNDRPIAQGNWAATSGNYMCMNACPLGKQTLDPNIWSKTWYEVDRD